LPDHIGCLICCLAQEAQVKSFDTSVWNGRWYISAGLNKIFDTFDCQVHFFNSPKPGLFFAKINWRVTEPDGMFCLLPST
jgi:violaxanthin de-epoxidase